MPEFLFDETHLETDSLFVDLGSGAGNTVAQAALTRGCKAFGIELRSAIAAIADTMVKAAIVRSQIWGVPVGKIDVVCGDMTRNAEVLE
ncbi:hypothetical protein GYMLUDRAFT_173912 [Collybiopsis luxurians FD-317 M1]|uniref:Histone-lysine N-methyltransferase, H3 lysine-79 specific n=1 Tax=Collybiopsis luxurians FD-317 M1 TaxID=944289 RepID=A0A0D0B0Y6_9AGAR|nr:hypothetical protein GYMLUDRAFT_173912 [Collybiopsis luxurians FD-317 M1]